jgi:hypothetical protein
MAMMTTTGFVGLEGASPRVKARGWIGVKELEDDAVGPAESVLYVVFAAAAKASRLSRVVLEHKDEMGNYYHLLRVISSWLQAFWPELSWHAKGMRP